MSDLREAAAEARDALEALRWGLEPKSVLARDLNKRIDNLKAALELELPATEFSVGIDWGTAGGRPCCTVIKKLPNGAVEVIACEYGPPVVDKAGIHYDVLHAYAEKHSLDYNELCRTLRQAAEPRCGCGYRPVSECPGEWEPGCDLGSNEDHAIVSNLKGDLMTKEIKSDYLWWADYIEKGAMYPEEVVILLRQGHQAKEALQQWYHKTDWVQETCTPRELGMHRADVLKARIDDLKQSVGTSRTVQVLANAMEGWQRLAVERGETIRELELRIEELQRRIKFNTEG